MKAKFLVIPCGMVILAYGCNSGTDSKTSATDTAKATTDTMAAMPKDTVTAKVAEAPPVIDSAAVTREYMAAQKKSKKTTPPKPKKQGANEVEMYSDAPIASHEAYEQPPAPKAGTAKPEPKVIHTKEYVYFMPSQKAEFPGGTKALNEYIGKNIEYPEDALRFHVEGTVYADVFLDSLGNVTKVEFPGTPLGRGLEEETNHVLMHSPRWVPAKENGVRVSSKVTVPVTYKITH